MQVRKRSEIDLEAKNIRANISRLMLDQQQMQVNGNDEQQDIIDGKIDKLRSKLKLVEDEQCATDNEDD